MAIYELEDRVYFDGAMPGDIAEAEDTSAEETENTANTSDIDSSNTDSVENVSIAPETGTAQDSSGDAENENGSGDDSDITGNGNGTDVSYLPDNDIDSVFAAIDDITLPDDFQPERNILIASSDYDRIDEITASVNDNTILITYDSNDTFDSIIQKLKDELGDTKALNIGIVDSDISEQLKVNSEQCDDFLDQLSGLKYYDGKINLIEITSGSPLNEDAAVSSDFTSLTLSADNNGDWTFSENADTELLPDYFGSDTSLLAANGDQLATDNEIYFIDYNVDDIDQILSEIPEDAIIIELAEGEGLDKITETVNLYHNIDAVHIISQANHAQILLGTDVITADNISEYQEAFSSWSDNLSSNADILFYGCNIAKEANGQSVLNHIAEWTGADIAASTDVTGGILAADSNQPAADIADWDMEFNIGNIEASALSVEAYRHHLATYTVTEITDNGTGTVEGSLSWAVEQSNLTTTVDDIINFNLSEGSTVTVSGGGLAITDDLTINGNGTSVIFEDGNAALEINDSIDSSQINVTINDLTLGRAALNGADDISQDDTGGNMIQNSENLTIVNTSIDDIGYVYAHIPGNVENPEIFLVSYYLEDVDDLVAAVKDNVIVLEYDPATTDLTELNQMVITALNGRKASSIAIAAHNSGKNQFYLTDSEIITPESTLSNSDQQKFWQDLASNIAEGGRIDLLACNLAEGTTGEILIASLENVTGINFAASNDATGNTENGGNWILETDNINAQKYFNTEKLLNYTKLMDGDEQKVTASDPAVSDNFGNSVSISSDGTTAIIGAYRDDSFTGSAYIFVKNGTWSQAAKLTASDRAAGDQFGWSVSISSDGTTAIIGAYKDDSSTGSAYIFVKNGTWSQTAKLTASDAEVSDNFGWSVSISSDGTTALIGAYKDDGNTGSAYIFVKNGTWSQTAKLTASDSVPFLLFGCSVSISSDGTTALIGARGDNDYTGAAYVFIKDGTWSQVAKLTASDGVPLLLFGCSVSVSSDGSTALIGAYRDDSSKGAAYIFIKDGTWINDTETAKLTASDGEADDYFGYSVSISSDGLIAIIGASDDDSKTGSAYVFSKNGAWTDAVEITKLTASDGEADDYFGYSVSISSDGSTSLVGARGDNNYTGAAYFLSNYFTVPELGSFSFSMIGEQTAGSTFSITVTAKDQYGDNFAYNGTATLSDSLDGMADTQITFTDGVYTGSITLTVAGSDTLTVTDGEHTGNSNSFTVDHAAVSSVIITPSGEQTITAGNTVQFSASAYDAYDNLITNTASDFIWTAATASGLFNTTTAGSYSVKAEYSSVSSSSVTVNVEHGGLDHFTINDIADGHVAGAGFDLVVTARDEYENTVTDYSGQTISVSDSGGTIDPTTTLAFAAGVSTTSVAVTLAGTDTITVTDGAHTGNSNSFTVIAAGLDHFTINNIADDQVAGTGFDLVVTARDEYENTVTNYSGQTISVSDSGGTIDPTTTLAFAAGVSTTSVAVTLAGTDTITVTDGAHTGNSNEFTVDHATVSSVIITPSGQQTITAGNTVQFSASAYDAYDNLITNTASDFIWTAATASGLFNTTTAGSYSVKAEYSSVSSSSVTVNVEHGGLDHFTINDIADGHVAGAGFDLVVTARDEYENTVTDYSGQTISVSDSGGTIDPTTTLAFAAGVSTTSVAVTLAGTDTITVTDGAHTGNSNSFTVIAAGLDHFTINNIADDQVAGTGFDLVVTARDEYENTVTNYSGQTISVSDSGGTIDPTTTLAFAAGVSTTSVAVTLAGTDTITVTDGAHTGNSNEFTVDHAAVSSVIITPSGEQTITAGDTVQFSASAYDAYDNLITDTASDFIWTAATASGLFNTTTAGSYSVKAEYNSVSSSSVTVNVEHGGLDHFTINNIADDQVAGAGFDLVVTARDEYENTVTDYSGQTISVSDSGGTIDPTTTLAFAAGVSTTSVAVTLAGTDTITVTDGAHTGNSNSFTVIAADLDHFTINNIADGHVAGAGFDLVVTARDEYENTVTDYSGQTISVSDSGGTIDPTTTLAFAAGVSTTSVAVTLAGTDTITVTDGAHTGNSNEFTVIAAGLDHFTINNIADDQVAGTGFDLVVTARDEYGNTVTDYSGQTISVSDSGGTIDPTTTLAFAAGVSTTSVAVTLAGTDTITVTDGAHTGNSNEFTVDHATVSSVIITPSGEQTITAGDTVQFSASAYDAYDNLITDTVSDFIWTDATASGLFNTTTAGSYSVKAEYSSVSSSSVTVNVEHGGLDHFTINNIADGHVAGTGFDLVVTARDEYENTVTNYSGQTISVSDSGGTIDPTTTLAFAAGVSTTSVAVTLTGTDTITVTDGAHTGNSNSFTVIAAELDHFTINNIADDQVAGAGFDLVVTARDEYENTVTDYSGQTISVSDTGGTIDPTTTLAFAAGVSTTSVAVTLVGTDTITVTDGAHTGNSNSFTVIVAGLDHFTINNIADDQVAGTGFDLVVTARDEYGNTVTDYSGQTISVSDSGGTIDPTTTLAFAAGVSTTSVAVTLAGTDTITVTDGAHTGNSNSFTVEHAAVSSVIITPLGEQTITAGDTVQFSASAYDAYNNLITDTVSDFIWTAATASGLFNTTTAGSYSVNAEYSSVSSSSVTVNVEHGGLDHFTINDIADGHVAGTGFDLVVTARDEYENTVTDYSGQTISVSDTGGTIDPTTTLAFAAGVSTTSVAVTLAGTDTITVTDGTYTGNSNEFTVDHAAVSSVIITPSEQQTITAGNSVQFSASAYDAYNNLITETASDFTWTDATASGLFNTTTAGSYSVNAEYNSVSSSSVTVNVKNPSFRPDVHNGGMINDGTDILSMTGWRTSIDSGAENSLDSREAFEPNQTEGIGLFLDSMITFDISAESVGSGSYISKNATDSDIYFDGEYGLKKSVFDFSSNGEYEINGSSDADAEFNSKFNGIVDLSFDLETADSLINFERIAIYNERHPLFKSELELILEKI